MKKLLFALSLVGIIFTHTLSYATPTENANSQDEIEQQEEAVAEEAMTEEVPLMEEVPAMEEEDAAPVEASFTQELKKRFIEGGPGFMGIVLICLILGLAIAIERIIFLNLATTNSQKLTNGVEEAISSGGVEAAKENSTGLYLHLNETRETHLGIYKKPVATGRGSGGFKYSIVPGKPEESILLHRMASMDPGVMMPESGRALTHEEAVEMVKEWILLMKD